MKTNRIKFFYPGGSIEKFETGKSYKVREEEGWLCTSVSSLYGCARVVFIKKGCKKIIYTDHLPFVIEENE